MKHIDYPFIFSINQNSNIASSFVQNKRRYVSCPLKEIKNIYPKKLNIKSYECEYKTIPLIDWILLKLKKETYAEDIYYENGDEIKTKVYAKILKGIVYILKSETYKNDILYSWNILKGKQWDYKLGNF